MMIIKLMILFVKEFSKILSVILNFINSKTETQSLNYIKRYQVNGKLHRKI